MSRPWRRFIDWFSKHKRRNSVVFGAAAIILIAGTWGLTRRAGDDAAVMTRTAEVTTGTMQETVTGSGTIAAASTNDLNFETAGQIVSVNVEAGDPVSKNQLLAQIDSASLRSQVAQAEASVSSAESKLSSDEDSGASDTQINADEASLASANAELASAEQNLSNAYLRSPINGTVSQVSLTVGQYVSSGSTGTGSSDSGSGVANTTANASTNVAAADSSSSSSQIQVISTGSYVVDLNVDETQVAKLSKGDQATITRSGTEDKIFGTVTSVGLVASTSSGVSSFPVQVRVTGNPKGVYPGTAAQVAITYRQLNDVVQVSTQAITRDGDKQTVQVVTDGGTETREITTGISSDGQTQVLTGLTAGEQVQITTRLMIPGGGSGSGGAGGFPGGELPSGGFPGGSGGLPGGSGGGPPAGAFPGGGQ